MLQGFPILGSFSTPRIANSANTANTMIIPPFEYRLGPGVISQGITNITKICYSCGSTAHTICIMRPFNFTTFTADAAASQAVVNIAADPGLYSTAANWKYRPFPVSLTGTTATPFVADNAIGSASTPYVAYQRADGTWEVNTVASASALAVTLTNNLGTGGVFKGGLMYYYGVGITDKDPNTGQINPQKLMKTSSTDDVTWNSDAIACVKGLHVGDPLVFYDANATAAGLLEFIQGYYSQT